MNSLHSAKACLSVVVPVYNEEQTLGKVVEKLLRLEQLYEIVIIDDCSQDRTSEIADTLAAEHAQILSCSGWVS